MKFKNILTVLAVASIAIILAVGAYKYHIDALGAQSDSMWRQEMTFNAFARRPSIDVPVTADVTSDTELALISE